LAVSVALNLAVAGLVGGIAFRGGPGMHGDMAVKDLGFGPFDGALSPEDRDSLRKTLRAHLGDLQSARKQMQVDGLAILSALRADPFDAAALSSAMDDQAQHLGQRLEFGNAIIRDHVLALSGAERLAFADRLEQRMRHGRGESDGKLGD
jgi:uncharacterized membrane protein